MIFLREATSRDLEILKELEKEALELGDFYRGNISSFIKGPNSFCILAEEKMQALGYLLGSVQKVGNHTRGTLKTLVVRPQERNKGVGRRLVEEIEKHLILKEVDNVNLEVEETDQAIVGFFLKLGYEVIGRFPNRFGEGRNALRLVKTFHIIKTSIPDMALET